MSRRDRYKGLVWLKRVVGDPPDGKIVPATYTKGSIHDSLTGLMEEMNLWVELEMVGDVYKVRCYPRQIGELRQGPKVCASYSGGRLAALLAVALLDYRQYQFDPAQAEMAPYEYVRWVA